MTATPEEAVDEVMALFVAAWVTGLGFTIVYSNLPEATAPPSAAPWARPKIVHLPGGDESLSQGNGGRRYDRNGQFTAQLFIPAGEGLSRGYSLSKIVLDAYEGQSTTSGVWFRNGRINEIGPDGDFTQFNVIMDFTYTEVK